MVSVYTELAKCVCLVHNNVAVAILISKGNTVTNVKSVNINEAKILGWISDMGLPPAVRLPQDREVAWAHEITLPQGLKVAVFTPKRLPRAVVVNARVIATPTHIEAFNNLEDDVKKDFWRDLSRALNRDVIEFIIEGLPTHECPRAFVARATRWDDGLTLDAFACTLGSVVKACVAAMTLVDERLGGGPALGSEFAFKKTTKLQ